MNIAKKYLSRFDVCERYGFDRTTLYRKMKKGRFPAPVGRNGKGYRWDKSVLDDFDENLREKSKLSAVVALGNI